MAKSTILVQCSTILIFSVIFCLSQKICDENQFRCNDGSCIKDELKCNGAVSCEDGSDEDFVTCRKTECKEDQFRCAYGGCVSNNATCDGVRDCVDNSDELHRKCRGEVDSRECLEQIIHNNSFFDIISATNRCDTIDRKCKDGELVGRSEKCNGEVNCKDGSDETLETCAAQQCALYAFQCKYGACIPASLMCDGVKNCADGSDELEDLCHTDNKGLCVLPAFPRHGYYSAADKPDAYPTQVFESITMNFSCHSGYKLVGSPFAYCVKGWWSASPPECVPQCRLSQHPSVMYLCLPRNSSSQEGARECGEMVEDGVTVRPRCREPNYYYPGVLVNMRCVDGVWDQVVVCSPQCGLVTAAGDQLVINGRAAARGELPWHAGIYKKTTNPYMQICGGSLVTSTMVISAAHCFWTETDKKLPASIFAVAVGKLYRPWNDPQDDDAQKSDVAEIKIPARFQGAAANFQEDIALVVVATPFEYRTYVRPVCVDFEPTFSRRQLAAGARGKVAGWGLTAEDGAPAPTLQVSELPFVDIDTCISHSPPGFTEYITSDKICAGLINGVEPAKVEAPSEQEPAESAHAHHPPGRCLVGGAHAFILKVSSYFGLAPLRFESRGNGFSVSLSNAMCIYSYILVTILVIMTILGLVAEIKVGVDLSVRMSSRMSQVVSTCDVLVVVATAGAGVYGAPRRMTTMLHFMGNVAMVDNSIGGKYSKVTERKLCALLLCILIFFSVLLADDFCFYAMQAKRTDRQWNVVMNYLGFYLLWYVVMILELQFAFTALSVRARFNAVNDALALTARARHVSVPLEKAKSPAPLNIYAIRVAPAGAPGGAGGAGGGQRANVSLLVDSLAAGGREQPVVMRKTVDGSAALGVSPSEAVRRVASLHSTLCEVVRRVDSSYGLPLIVVLISTLLHLIVTPYFLIMEIIVSTNRVHFLVLQFVWCLTHMLRMLVVVEPCHYTIAEGRRTQSLVCRLMNNVSEEPTLGTLPSRIELFSRQLLLQSVCYSPLGMCTLDRRLVASVIGAVTTYLVILIQFQRYDT